MNPLPAAVEKIVREGQCRICTSAAIETAHLVPRGRGAPRYDQPDICIPLCKRHHTAFDDHELDVLPYIDRDEEVATVRLLGIERAYKQLVGYDYREASIL